MRRKLDGEEGPDQFRKLCRDRETDQRSSGDSQEITGFDVISASDSKYGSTVVIEMWKIEIRKREKTRWIFR